MPYICSMEMPSAIDGLIVVDINDDIYDLYKLGTETIAICHRHNSQNDIYYVETIKNPTSYELEKTFRSAVSDHASENTYKSVAVPKKEFIRMVEKIFIDYANHLLDKRITGAKA